MVPRGLVSWAALLVAAVAAIYAPFLWNPPVFDDAPIFAARGAIESWLLPSPFDFRSLPYATLAWTKELFGTSIAGFRVGNLVLHAGNTVLLFLFLRNVFQASVPAGVPHYHTRLAFLCGLVFALHPVAVYGAAYLVQRSILLAMLFCFLMWMTYLRGLVGQRQGLLLVSALFYYLAVFSKELSIMAPAVALALALLVRRPSLALFKMIAPSFLLFTAIALFAVFKAQNTIGALYEPQVHTMLGGIDAYLALPLSVMNQAFLFFKYLLLWLFPHPGWMSVDMRELFPSGFLSMPQALGPPLFVLFLGLGAWLLLDRESSIKRLAGFALLVPALMFVTEFMVVRVQEPFVLYRSYLWFGGFFAIVPVIADRFDPKKVTIALAAISLAFVPVTWNRLTTFSDLLLLWQDAAALVAHDVDVPGADRIFYNRGNAFLARKRTEEAFDDYTTAIRLNPEHAGAYNNRGTILFNAGRYADALRDFMRAVDINPRSRRPYFGVGMSYYALGNEALAEENLMRSCDMRLELACAQLKRLRKESPATAQVPQRTMENSD